MTLRCRVSIKLASCSPLDFRLLLYYVLLWYVVWLDFWRDLNFRSCPFYVGPRIVLAISISYSCGWLWLRWIFLFEYFRGIKAWNVRLFKFFWNAEWFIVLVRNLLWMVGLIRITVVRAKIKLFGLTLVYLGTIFKHKCFFNFILGHDVREGHIVNF